VSVCICTYQRSDLLRRLLEKLALLETENAFTYSAVVADNDAARSAEPLVRELSARLPYPIVYCSEPTKNIALVRNQALAHARGDYIAFIDDDEFPVERWLIELLRTCEKSGAAGVLGPVRPYFDTPPPAWLVKGRFCERPEHPTGTVMEGGKCRTGNVLFRRALIEGDADPFRREFGTGGEDVDFFLRMNARGHTFVWCNEAPAYETVPPSRWTRRYLINRALLRGRNNLKLKGARTRLVLQSCLAVPLYSLVLPFTLLGGQHVFMNYAIRFCDHLGRLLTMLHLNPVGERQM
jgi:glycosyltransferase involved in cell wall biosynthesis